MSASLLALLRTCLQLLTLWVVGCGVTIIVVDENNGDVASGKQEWENRVRLSGFAAVDHRECLLCGYSGCGGEAIEGIGRGEEVCRGLEFDGGYAVWEIIDVFEEKGGNWVGA